MNNKRRKNRTKVLIYLGLIAYVIYILIQQQMYLLACNKEDNYYLSEIEKQKKISGQLKNQEQFCKTDEFIEKTAREKLGMVLPGEKIFVDVSQ